MGDTQIERRSPDIGYDLCFALLIAHSGTIDLYACSRVHKGKALRQQRNEVLINGVNPRPNLGHRRAHLRVDRCFVLLINGHGPAL